MQGAGDDSSHERADRSLTHLIISRAWEANLARNGEAGAAELLQRAADRAALPLFYRHAQASDVHIPAGIAARWREHLARLALYRSELERTVSALESITPVVVLKGAPLAQLLYGDDRLRFTTDLDLLISPESVDEAIELLASLDYERVHPETPAKTWTYNQYALAHRGCGLMAELHWRIAFPHMESPPIEFLFDQTRSVRCGDRAYETLRPEVLFLHLCYHFHQHLGFFKGLLDIAGWIDRFEATADLEEIERLAKRWRIGGMVQWPLHVLRALVGVQSDLLHEEIDPFVRAWVAWTSDRLERDMVDVAPESALQSWFEEDTFATRIARTAAKTLSMTVADGARAKLRASAGPSLFGPHRAGRAVYGALERLGLADRDDLFRNRLLG